MPEQHFAGRTVVVTGASAGVGRAVAVAFGRQGAKLCLIARDSSGLREAREEVEAAGATAIAIPADVADADAVFAAAARCESELGPIDIWVNDAMATVYSKVADATPEEIKRVTEVTYLGFVNGTMAALELMRPRNRGVIVQIGSGLAYRAIPLQAAYCGAKHAIRGFTDALRCELIAEKSAIRLTAVHLPAVNTPQFSWAREHIGREPRPVAPVYRPEAIAERILEAAHRCPREYWIGNRTPLMILGDMLIPAFFDRFLANSALEGQKTDRPTGPDRRDNLFAPVEGLHSTGGAFSDEAADSAVAISGEAARLAAVAIGSLVFAALGFLLGAVLM